MVLTRTRLKGVEGMYNPFSSEGKFSLSVRVSETEMALVKSMATKHHRTVSDEVRHLIREAAGRDDNHSYAPAGVNNEAPI